MDKMGFRRWAVIGGALVVAASVNTEIAGAQGEKEFKADGSPADILRNAKSKTHGDINDPSWQKAGTDLYRVKAGSASDLGGLMTGDGFPNQADPWRDVGGFSNYTFPLFVWEGFLLDGENKVVITPFLIEDDRKPGETNPYEELNRIGANWDPTAKKNVFNPTMLQLSFAEAERIVTTKDPNSDLPAGIFVVHYVTSPLDNASGGTPHSADYSLYLQVKKIQ